MKNIRRFKGIICNWTLATNDNERLIELERYQYLEKIIDE